MKLICIFISTFFLIQNCFAILPNVPSCFALHSLSKVLPSSYTTPKVFKSLSEKDFSITISTVLDLENNQIPINIGFFFNKKGKLSYRSLSSEEESKVISKEGQEIISKTKKFTALAALESFIKLGLYTKIGLTFPHLTFLITIEEILSAYKPHVQKTKNNYEISYFYGLYSEKVISRVMINIKFNKNKIFQIIHDYLKKLPTMTNIWKNKRKLLDIENLSQIIRERIVLLELNLESFLNQKELLKKGKLIEIPAKKIAKLIVFDKGLYEGFLNEMKKQVFNFDFGKYMTKLKNSYYNSFNWFEELLVNLNPKAREFALKHLRFLYENGPMNSLGSKGFLSLKSQKPREKRINHHHQKSSP